MSIVEVRDHALWAKHIHGNEPLKEKILALPEKTVIELIVDGERGHWKKMDNGVDGRPTPGIKGIGPARDSWHALQNERGKTVTIEELKSAPKQRFRQFLSQQ